MALQRRSDYEKVVELVEQLPEEQQTALLTHLLEKAQNRQLTKEEKKSLFHAGILSVPLREAPSIRRQDWYGDDGR